MRRHIALISFCLFLLLVSPACAQDALRPALGDPLDQRIQQLAVMSQRDAAFENVPYTGGLFMMRGCQPASIANGLIALFGVTQKEQAADIMMETLRLMVPRKYWGGAPIEPGAIADVIDPQARREQADTFPALASVIGAYPGSTYSSNDRLSLNSVLSLIENQPRPAVLTWRMYVNPSWEGVVRILCALHDMGMDDALLCVAQAGGGTETSGGPFRSTGSGHYVTLLFHVGAFMESGTVYLLDSLPRALEGEEYGGENILRTPYAYPANTSNRSFIKTFAAERISETIVKFSLRPEKLALLDGVTGEEQILERIRLMKPMLIFGSCLIMASLPANAP